MNYVNKSATQERIALLFGSVNTELQAAKTTFLNHRETC